MCAYVHAHDSTGAQPVTYSSRGNVSHPPGLPSIWKGRDVSELVAGLGEPDIVLETKVNGFDICGYTYAVIYVYGSKSGTDNSCYAAYVVEHDSGEILAHHCR